MAKKETRGRKSVVDKKVPLRLYVHESIIKLNGGEEVAKASCIEHLTTIASQNERAK